MTDSDARIRVDKWLWHARFFKSRSLAAEVASTGRLRINSERCSKPAQAVRPGDVLTFPQGGRVRVVRIEEIGTRRGPAPEAQALYTDLDPPAATAPAGSDAEQAAPDPPQEGRDPGAGRPTKRERREIDRLRQFDP
ncbi:MAG: RNA-binding S4 domain-containing protein [Pseudomonadota bacterium]